MRREHFSKEEADAKVGKRVVSTVDFSGIPKGTAGIVVRAESTLDGNFLVVQWGLPWFYSSPRNAWPYEDWFTNVQYHEWLSEV